MIKKIYVASSWRNEHQDALVKELRALGYEVYDFKHPHVETIGFQWSDIDSDWQNWTMPEYRAALRHEHAQFGFNRDFDEMKEADACVLCLPCGRSAHLEAGWMKGARKRVIAFIPPNERIEPELMYGMLDGIALNIQELATMLKTESLFPTETAHLAGTMKLYIATPINARKEPTLREQLLAAKHRIAMLKEILADDVQFKNYELISTFDFNNMYDADEKKAMTNCIYHVLTSDAIYLDHGWQGSKGCNLEYRTAKIYGKKIYEHDNL